MRLNLLEVNSVELDCRSCQDILSGSKDHMLEPVPFESLIPAPVFLTGHLAV